VYLGLIAFAASFQDHERISSEAAENTALIIGVIAGLLIGVILIILVILKVKNRSAPSYKIGETAQHSPHAALIAQHTSPSPRNGAPPPGSTSRRPKGAKDVKEWYVWKDLLLYIRFSYDLDGDVSRNAFSSKGEAWRGNEI